jgi:hypothetical protein
MKGFIEFTLVLMLALLSPQIIELNQNIKNQIKNFAKYKKDTKTNSDLNYYLINENIKDYRPKYEISEQSSFSKNYKIRQVKIDNKLSKILVETNTNRIFNWKKFRLQSKEENNCFYNYYELNKSTFFDCEHLKITHLKANSESRIANTGTIDIDLVTQTKWQTEIIAYQKLTINKINASEYSSLLLFSQLEQVELKQSLGCELINLQISDQNLSSRCFSIILDTQYWPNSRIISTKLP